MTKPRLVKVRALFYVLQQIQKEAAPILTQPPLACQSGWQKNIAQTRLQESIGYATLHLCLSLQVPLTDTLPDSHPIIRTEMPSLPSLLFYS